jgi:hypothetical protein
MNKTLAAIETMTQAMKTAGHSEELTMTTIIHLYYGGQTDLDTVTNSVKAIYRPC